MVAVRAAQDLMANLGMMRSDPTSAPALRDYDVVIVGTGPVGATYARTIVDQLPHARVLMIDAGPQLTPLPGTNTRNLHRPEEYAVAKLLSQGPAQYAYPASNVTQRLKGPGPLIARPGTYLIAGDGAHDMPAAAASTNVGGMGAHWTCACPRPADSEVTSSIEESELQRLYVAGERLLQVTSTVFQETASSLALQQTLLQVFGKQLGQRGVQPMPLACSVQDGTEQVWSGSDTVLGEYANPANHIIELWTETVCRRVVLEGGHAKGVLCEHLPSGVQAEVRARIVVLACDALRTPQLLWASGIRPQALGHYLNDQPQIIAVIRLPESVPGEVSRGVFWVPYSDPLHPFHGQVMDMDTSPVPVAATDTSQDDPGRLLSLGWFCAKDVRFEDCIGFSDDAQDYVGMPAPIFRYGLTALDEVRVKMAIDCVARAAAALGGEYLPGYEPRMIPPGSSLHYQGSTRMGIDPGDSVVDSFSRVWSFPNLFLGGNGVIAAATACNPTLTSCALAVRAAEEIVRQLGCGSKIT